MYSYEILKNILKNIKYYCIKSFCMVTYKSKLRNVYRGKY